MRLTLLIPIVRRTHRLLGSLIVVFMIGAVALAQADDHSDPDRFDDHETLVSETHAASFKLRRQVSLRENIARGTAWSSGIWGDNLWCLSALYLNEKTDEANARLLKQAEVFVASNPALWLWVRGESRLAEAGVNDQFLLLGTGNHNLNRRQPYYLITALLTDDPAYRDWLENLS